MSKNFSDLGIHEDLVQGVDSMGITTPTAIQEQAIPAILSGKDVLGIAQTGTGKTAAFLLPIIQKITERGDRKNTSALIIVPTRELATQIDQAIQAYGYFTDISSIPIYGGGDGKIFNQERHALESGADIVVATPGRLNMHLNLGYVNFSQLQFLILDEADRMLDMGFMPDIQRILKHTAEQKQSLLFSATMPDNIFRLAASILKNPVNINIALSKPPSNVEQGAFVIYSNQKIGVLMHYLRGRKEKSTIIFSSRKAEVNGIQSALRRHGFSSLAMSSDLEQSEREFALNEFRNQKCKILVATDVMSRGIDIKGVDVVINFDVPGDAEDYVHRIGRTGRAEAKGEAVTFVVPEEQIKFKKIETLIQSVVTKLPVDPQFGEAPLYDPKVQAKPKKSGKRFGKPRPKS